MSLQTQINRIIDIYGIDATVRQYTTATNDYGEKISDAYVDTPVKVVLYNNIKDNYLREVFGVVPKGVQTFLVKPDVTLDNNSTIITNNKEYHVTDTSTIMYKGDVIAIIVSCS